MPLFFKRDMQATRQARRDGTFLSRESYMSKPKAVGKPGGPGFHEGPHELLAGVDMRRRYQEVLKRDGRSCAKCGAVIGEDDSYTWLELHHLVHRGRGGCDCISNLTFFCKNWNATGCHDRTHRQPVQPEPEAVKA